MKERRKFARIVLGWPAQLTCGDKHWEVELEDLSLKGVLLSRPEGYTAGTHHPLLLHIHIPQSQIDIEMELAEAHISDDLLGMSCTKIDIDSISQLRRLIELNIGNDELLNRELDHLSTYDEG